MNIFFKNIFNLKLTLIININYFFNFCLIKTENLVNFIVQNFVAFFWKNFQEKAKQDIYNCLDEATLKSMVKGFGRRSQLRQLKNYKWKYKELQINSNPFIVFCWLIWFFNWLKGDSTPFNYEWYLTTKKSLVKQHFFSSLLFKVFFTRSIKLTDLTNSFFSRLYAEKMDSFRPNNQPEPSTAKEDSHQENKPKEPTEMKQNDSKKEPEKSSEDEIKEQSEEKDQTTLSSFLSTLDPSDPNLPSSTLPNKKPESGDSLELWKIILKMIWLEDPDSFYDSVKLQRGKKRMKDDSPVSYEAAINHLEKNTEHTLGIDLSALRQPIICIDIDISLVGERLLEALLNPGKVGNKFNCLGTPFVVQTERSNHLHLYYRAPAGVGHFCFKKLLPTRLGFKAEFIYNVVTVVGWNRHPILTPTFESLSSLPQSLYPYNYERSDRCFSLIQELQGEENKKIYARLTEGNRNQCLFDFFWVDNFTEDHVLLANYICCDPPLNLSEIKKTIIKKNPVKASGLSFFILNMNNTGRKGKSFAPEFADVEDERTVKARERDTPIKVIDFVKYIEKEFKVEIPDDAWIGASLETVLIYVLLFLDYIKVYYIKVEQMYVVWNGKYWEDKTHTDVCGSLFSAARWLKYGALEKVVTQKDIHYALQALSNVDSWPSPYDWVGHSYQNGIVYYQDRKLQLIPHHPKFMHRRLIESDYVPNVGLNLSMHAVLNAFASGKVEFFNILRLMIYLTINPGYGNIAFYIYGLPQAGKSVLINFLRSLLPPSGVGTLDEKVIKSTPAVIADFVRGKNLVVVPDASNRNLSGMVTDLIKAMVGRDMISTNVKYKDGITFESKGVVVVGSNLSPTDLKAFSDVGFRSRFITISIPSINPDFQVEEILRVMKNHRNLVTNWAMNINAEFVWKNIRGDGINAIVTREKPEIEQFVFERLCFEKNAKTTNKTLITAYNNYRSQDGFFEQKGSPINSINKYLLYLAQLVGNVQRIYQYRTSVDRGWMNVSLRPTSGKLGPNQERFKRRIDLELKGYLEENPWKYFGYCYYNTELGFIQDGENCEAITFKETTLGLSVNENGLNLAQVLRKRPLFGLGVEPNFFNAETDISHLTEPTKAPWAKIYPRIILRDPLNPIKLLADPIIEDSIKNTFIYLKGVTTLRLAAVNTEKGKEFMKIASEEAINLKKAFILKSKTFKLRVAKTFKLRKEETQESTDNKQETTQESTDNKQETTQESTDNKQETTQESTDNKQETTQESTDNKQETTQESTDNKQETTQKRNIEKPLNKEAVSNFTDREKNQKEEKSFIKSFQKAFKGKTKGLKKAVSLTFNEALKGFRNHAEDLRKESEDFNFITRYEGFEAVYPNASLFNSLMEQLKRFPLKGPYHFINTLNSYFADRIFEAWQLNQKAENWDPNDYFAKALPGSGKDILQQNSEKFLEALNNLPEKNFSFNLKEGGWSVFPYLYTSGKNKHGRFLSLPTTGVSGLKHTCKSAIIKVMAEKTKEFNFAEIDIKSCHTIVAFACLTSKGVKVPEFDLLWPTLINQFKKSLKEKEDEIRGKNNQVYDKLASWSDAQIKGILKTQWYKALNNGAVFNAKDNVENGHVALDISKENINEYVEEINFILKDMTLFKEISGLQKKLSANKQLFLPTDTEPFLTNTKSNKQLDEGKGGNFSMTAMSRLFTHCEVTVIIMLYLAISKISYEVFPISYEADGLLIVGKFSKEDLPEMLKQINTYLKEYVTLLFYEPFEVEFKKTSCK